MSLAIVHMLTGNQLVELEDIQRKASRIILRQKKREETYESRLDELQLQPLRERWLQQHSRLLNACLTGGFLDTSYRKKGLLKFV